MMIDDQIQLDPPLHLIAGQTTCWRCGAPMPVVAILCENLGAKDEGPFILSNITELPPELYTYVQRFYPDFRLTFSKTIGEKYFANNCPKCGVISGDFFLHSADEPGREWRSGSGMKASTRRSPRPSLRSGRATRPGKGKVIASTQNRALHAVPLAAEGGVSDDQVAFGRGGLRTGDAGLQRRDH
jgi:hypothetical protein